MPITQSAQLELQNIARLLRACNAFKELCVNIMDNIDTRSEPILEIPNRVRDVISVRSQIDAMNLSQVRMIELMTQPTYDDMVLFFQRINALRNAVKNNQDLFNIAFDGSDNRIVGPLPANARTALTNIINNDILTLFA